MKKLHYIFLLLHLQFIVCPCIAQNKTIDSLLTIYNSKNTNEIKKISLAKKIIFKYVNCYDTAFIYYKKFYKDFTISKNKNGIASIGQTFGSVALECSKYSEAKYYLESSKKKFIELKNDTMAGFCITNYAFVDYTQGNYESAIKNYLTAITIFEQHNSHNKLAWAYNLMGLCFYSKPNPSYDKALFYYFKALEIYKTNGFVLLRIGSTYCQLKNYNKSNYYLNKSLKFGDSLNDEGVKLWSLEGLTQLYKDKKEYALALIYAEKTLNLVLQTKSDIPGVVIAYRNFSEINYLLNNTKKSIPNIDSAIYYSLKHNIYQTLPEIYLLKSNILELDKNINGSLKYYKLYVKIKDSLFNVQNSKNINDLEAVFDSKQKQKEIVFLNNQKTADKKIKQILLGSFLLSLILVIVAIYAIIKINKSKKLLKNKNTEINIQKNLLETKQKEIISSIRYAKRIQQSLMPTEKYIERILKIKK